MKRLTVSFVCAVVMLGVAGATYAQNKCAGAKEKAAGKKAACLLALESKQAKSGDPIDPEKSQKCIDKYTSAFAKAEGKGECLTTGDVDDVEDMIDAFIADVDGQLGVGIPNDCASSKLKAAGKKAKCLIGLEAKQAQKGGSIDPEKQQKCIDKFTTGFAKAEEKGECNTLNDVGTVEDTIDTFVAALDDALNPAGPVTTTTSIPGGTTTSTIPTPVCGNNNVEGSETCDDGNTSNNDACPGDCIVDACTPIAATNRQASISFDAPVGVGVAGMTVLLDYPEGKVSLPGSGGSIPAGIIADFPSGASGASNDFDHALRQVVSRTTNMPEGLLFRVHFEDCQSAPAPVAGDFTCTVLDAADQNGIDVSGVTCSVTVP